MCICHHKTELDGLCVCLLNNNLFKTKICLWYASGSKGQNPNTWGQHTRPLLFGLCLSLQPHVQPTPPTISWGIKNTGLCFSTPWALLHFVTPQCTFLGINHPPPSSTALVLQNRTQISPKWPPFRAPSPIEKHFLCGPMESSAWSRPFPNCIVSVYFSTHILLDIICFLRAGVILVSSVNHQHWAEWVKVQQNCCDLNVNNMLVFKPKKWMKS